MLAFRLPSLRSDARIEGVRRRRMERFERERQVAAAAAEANAQAAGSPFDCEAVLPEERGFRCALTGDIVEPSQLHDEVEAHIARLRVVRARRS